MDVESLKNELEDHLKRNPDEHAPSGFRDRFAATIEDIEAAEDEESKTELQAQLQQIRAEAEAAAKCAECGDAPSAEAELVEAPIVGASAPAEQASDAGAARAEAVEAPVVAASAPAEQVSDAAAEPAASAAPAEVAREPVAEPTAGLMQRYGLILAAILIALVVAIYFYR